MDFVAHWKNWIRPLALMIYFILMMIAIPLCVVEVSNKTQEKHIKAWFTGGVFVLMTVPISVYEIILHVINYNQPNLQKYIIRILWMVPIYALNAWFGLRFSVAAIYLDTIRECYEAYVIYNFMAYLLSFLWTVHPQLEIALSKTKQQKHIFPFCCLPVWPMGSKMLQNAKHGVLQYTVVRPITTFIALICEISGVYHEGEFSPKSGWLYVTILNNVSQIWAMYCLVLFYKATKEMLAPIKPIPKFLCVKFVVFFSFWQSVVIAAFGKFGLIQESLFYDNDVNQLAAAMQDFCICIEMFIAAIMHYFAFSHEPFVNTAAPQGNCCQSFASMWDVGDVKDDVLEHVKVVTTTMKKTVSAPFLRRKNEPGNEKTPLLQSRLSQNDEDRSINQITEAEINHKSYQGQTDTESLAPELDITSLDRWQSKSAKSSKSVSSSMHNFYESSSVDVRSLQSDTIEHLGDSAHRTISESAEQSGDIDDNTELPRDIDQGRANQGDTALIVGTPKVSIQSGDASLRNESEGNYSGISEIV